MNVGRLVFTVAVDNGASARGVGTSPRWVALKSGQAGGGPLEPLVVEDDDTTADDEEEASDDDTCVEDADEPVEDDVGWLDDGAAEEDTCDEETPEVAAPEEDTGAEEPAEEVPDNDDDVDATDDENSWEVPDPTLEEPERELAAPELLAVPLEGALLVTGLLVPDMALLLPEVSATKPLLDAVVTCGTSTQWLACTSHVAPEGQSASSTHAMDVTQPDATTLSHAANTSRASGRLMVPSP